MSIDPVKICLVYLREGCSHVDGFECDITQCEILENYKGAYNEYTTEQ